MKKKTGNSLVRGLLLMALVIVLLLPSVNANPQAMPKRDVGDSKDLGDASDFASMLAKSTESKKYRHVLQQFVAAASDGDLVVMTSLISSQVKETVGEQEIAKTLERIVVPFFSDYEKLHNVMVINPAADQTGKHKGYWFYTYINTNSGKTRPFSMCVIDDGDKQKVIAIVVDQCRAGRHPFCP